jgi:hypothetical protein
MIQRPPTLVGCLTGCGQNNGPSLLLLRSPLRNEVVSIAKTCINIAEHSDQMRKTSNWSFEAMMTTDNATKLTKPTRLLSIVGLKDS